MKKTWVRKTLSVGVLAAGALLFAPAAAAQADVDQVTFGNFGGLNGTQVAVPVKVPVNVVGNAIGVGGVAVSKGVGANYLESASTGDVDQLSAKNVGLLNGTQVAVPITVPVNVAGNSAAVLGKAFSHGVAANRVESAKTEHGWGGGDGVGDVDQISAYNVGALNGTQVAVPITVPINACGNAIAIIGASSANGICANVVGSQGRKSWKLEGRKNRAESGWDGGGNGVGNVGQISTRNWGALNGTQIAAPITVPINVCGNSLAVLGLAQSSGACVNYVGGGDRDRKHLHWVKPVKPVWGDDDILGDGDDCGAVKGIVKGDGYGCDDDGDVRGDNGYKDDQGVKNDGYGKPAADVADDGYGGQAPDQYGDHNHGGRKAAKAEKSPVAELTDGLGGVGSAGIGGLDLLNTLR
ncbi:chaplin family protein [Actinoplanes sp. NPDC024001]|uniref:chaplin family protein n=1 Tax=Actinoplanes sp. NPDC024001 TaxID=3154598 RepID=UPI0033F12FB0